MLRHLTTAFTLFILFESQAQIVYTDISPDSVFNCASGIIKSFEFDLDNDGNNDFKLKYRYNQLMIETLNSNFFSKSTAHEVRPYNIGDTIKPNDQWGTADGISTFGYLWEDHGAYGNFYPLNDGYIGLKLISGINTYYGWIRLYFKTAPASPHDYMDTLIVKDFAYQSTPNTYIIAGDGTGLTGIKEAVGPEVKVFVFEKLLHLELQNESISSCCIYDISGKEIFKTGGNNIIDLSGLGRGMYLVMLKGRNKVYNQKILIAD